MFVSYRKLWNLNAWVRWCSLRFLIVCRSILSVYWGLPFLLKFFGRVCTCTLYVHIFANASFWIKEVEEIRSFSMKTEKKSLKIIYNLTFGAKKKLSKKHFHIPISIFPQKWDFWSDFQTLWTIFWVTWYVCTNWIIDTHYQIPMLVFLGSPTQLHVNVPIEWQ